jgi:nitrite reductase (cytochrome c-552)
MRRLIGYGLFTLGIAAATAGVTALLINIVERKEEGRHHFVPLTVLTEDTIDPAEWGKNFPRQYDGYKRTVDTERTRYGGSEAFSKLDMDPAWKRFFAGYAFGVDYREERGHAYSLADQQLTERTKQFKQPGACLQCHAGGMQRVYERVGGGDAQEGFRKVGAMPIEEAWKHVEHPIACLDCHDPATMQLRVTRPGFLNAIKELKAREGVANYDPNTMATRQEMRTFVCAQCHVEYYCGPKATLFYPWANGVKVEEIEAYYERYRFKDGGRFYDWKHAETGAEMLKAQHPEFELWSQGIHARSGVACADCHMPYMRQGAVKVTDHHIRSPLLNVLRACMQCHHFPEQEMLARAHAIQDRTRGLLDRGEEALVDLLDAIKAAKADGASDDALRPALEWHRKAQWRLDFVAAENSMGFHAPQEAARILAEAIDYARQGQVAAERTRGRAKIIGDSH